jgi:Fe-S cluster assembly protein SufD
MNKSIKNLTTDGTLLGWDKNTVAMISEGIKEPAMVAERRLAAFKQLQKTSWPTSRDEEWRHTNPFEIGKNKFRLWNSISDKVVPDVFKRNGQRGVIPDNVTFIQLVNGVVVNRQITKPFQLKNAIIDDIRNIGDRWENEPDGKAESEGENSDALNLMFDSFYQSGVFISIPPNVSSKMPIYISSINNTPQGAMFYQNYFRLQKGCDITIILHLKCLSDAEQWLASKTKIVVEDNATFNLLVLNETESTTFLTEDMSIEAGRDAKVNVVGIDLTNGWSVINRNMKLIGAGCEVKLHEVHLGTNNSHMDLRTTQQHLAPSTRSDLLYKTAMFGDSHSVFQGLINIQPEAVNSNAYQMNRNLLLGENASTDSIPKLEILVDEVRCSHGATAGFLDKNIIFYLMSRGMTYDQSLMLLLDGFLREVPSILEQPEVLGLAEKKLVDFIKNLKVKSETNS